MTRYQLSQLRLQSRPMKNKLLMFARANVNKSFNHYNDVWCSNQKGAENNCQIFFLKNTNYLLRRLLFQKNETLHLLSSHKTKHDYYRSYIIQCNLCRDLYQTKHEKHSLPQMRQYNIYYNTCFAIVSARVASCNSHQRTQITCCYCCKCSYRRKYRLAFV